MNRSVIPNINIQGPSCFKHYKDFIKKFEALHSNRILYEILSILSVKVENPQFISLNCILSVATPEHDSCHILYTHTPNTWQISTMTETLYAIKILKIRKRHLAFVVVISFYEIRGAHPSGAPGFISLVKVYVLNLIYQFYLPISSR